MYRSRVIPCLLLKGKGLYKTTRFKEPRYLGDPINTLRLFNDKEVDEVVLLDISATVDNNGPNINYLRGMVAECFMPVCYGGGISTLNQVEALYKIGIEKVSFNTALYNNPELVKEAAKTFGSQSIVASLDVKKSLFGPKSIYIKGGSQKIKENPLEYAKRVEELGVGEILLTSIDYEGKMNGYDYELIEKISSAVSIPVIANGGAGNLSNCVDAISAGASAAAAGSLFVYYGSRKAVLVNYPTQEELTEAFKKIKTYTSILS
ncbi:AglZ/HisF2 family acetamidino modification protein [Falsibacillus albus]|uniref:Imidazole glycerol phosphate synthase subunit HisF n=1 Tax=Falsibacillus albus TaxID=2478915 RepID=A0A3L7JYN2_9BACI|nr:AglZ/HisF2 family acetamidino modification protein [Falsibacillus albus]RLQ94811.1 imidazole glycerol phosphate synthase subunit HisF [Falsibacillus albus]